MRAQSKRDPRMPALNFIATDTRRDTEHKRQLNKSTRVRDDIDKRARHPRTRARYGQNARKGTNKLLSRDPHTKARAHKHDATPTIVHATHEHELNPGEDARHHAEKFARDPQTRTEYTHERAASRREIRARARPTILRTLASARGYCARTLRRLPKS